MHTAPLRIGTFTRSLLLDVARAAGHLEHAGIDVVEGSVPSSPAQFSALVAGELDIVLTSQFLTVSTAVAALRKRIDDALVSQAAGIDPVVTGSTGPEGRH